jgi:hypothetical protein
LVINTLGGLVRTAIRLENVHFRERIFRFDRDVSTAEMFQRVGENKLRPGADIASPRLKFRFVGLGVGQHAVLDHHRFTRCILAAKSGLDYRLPSGFGASVKSG